MSNLCMVKGCTHSLKAKGLCNAHYQRVRRHGDVGTEPVADRRAREPRRLLAWWCECTDPDLGRYGPECARCHRPIPLEEAKP